MLSIMVKIALYANNGSKRTFGLLTMIIIPG